MAYVTRDGATRATRPFALAACVWGAVDVVDAFFRTLLVDGYAETYAGRGPTRDATPRARRRDARARRRRRRRERAGIRERAHDRSRRADGGRVRTVGDARAASRARGDARARSDAPSDETRAGDAAVGMTSTTSPPRSMTASPLGARVELTLSSPRAFIL